ncbi:MAG TPA: hypothetical protein VFB62_27065 [Polyangiaceae bacterium]|jgi:hypothetical protein|nr:hypothetical protein [Polyangiaceae bacterium]
MTRLYAILLLSLAACDKPQPNGSPPPTPAPETPPPAPTQSEPAPTASEPPPETKYDPCVGRPCGSPCNICPPDDANCVETAVVKNCNEQGKCTQEMAKCPKR